MIAGPLVSNSLAPSEALLRGRVCAALKKRNETMEAQSEIRLSDLRSRGQQRTYSLLAPRQLKEGGAP